MCHLLSNWQQVAPRLSLAEQVFLFLDYDGTLTPIAPRPEEAIVSPRIKEKLISLANSPKISLGIISGRSLREITEAVDLPGIAYAGNHGLEICSGTIGMDADYIPQAALEVRGSMQRIRRDLERRLGGLPGILIEDKGLTLSVHYRLAETSVAKVAREAFFQVIDPLGEPDDIRVTLGRKVWEVRPNIDWGKGHAVLWLLRERPHALPVYLGDDRTDEDAFAVISDKGITVKVGMNKRSKANYFLNSVTEVAQFLDRMAEI